MKKRNALSIRRRSISSRLPPSSTRRGLKRANLSRHSDHSASWTSSAGWKRIDQEAFSACPARTGQNAERRALFDEQGVGARALGERIGGEESDSAVRLRLEAKAADVGSLQERAFAGRAVGGGIELRNVVARQTET